MNIDTKIGKIFQHKKSGGNYKVLAVNAHLESEGLTGDLFVVYASKEDSYVWIREQNEFFDGRFKEI